VALLEEDVSEIEDEDDFSGDSEPEDDAVPVEINFTSSSVLVLVTAVGTRLVGINDELVVGIDGELLKLGGGGGDDTDEGGIEIENGLEVAPEVGSKEDESL